MKTALFFARLVCLNFLMCHPARSQDIDTNTADFNFSLVPAAKVLDIYQKITKSELVMPTDIPREPRWITLHIAVPREEVARNVPNLLEQALMKQANIVIRKVDDKQVSVTYEKYDIKLNLDKGRQTAPLIIVLTSNDVRTNTVHLATQPTDHTQNLIIQFAYKSSEEIETLVWSPNHRAQIMKDGVVVAESEGYAGYLDSTGEKFKGLDLLFSNYDEAKLAEKALRGD